MLAVLLILFKEVEKSRLLSLDFNLYWFESIISPLFKLFRGDFIIFILLVILLGDKKFLLNLLFFLIAKLIIYFSIKLLLFLIELFLPDKLELFLILLPRGFLAFLSQLLFLVSSFLLFFLLFILFFFRFIEAKLYIILCLIFSEIIFFSKLWERLLCSFLFVSY